MYNFYNTGQGFEVERPKNLTVTEGEEARFVCRAKDNPDATTQWVKQPDMLEDDENPTTNGDVSLGIVGDSVVTNDRLDEVATVTKGTTCCFGLMYFFV